MRSFLLAAGLVFALGVPVSADNLDDAWAQACSEAGLDPLACATVTAVLDGGERAGVSAGDFRDDATAGLEVADFYFAAKVAVVRDGQTVRWSNSNDVGGNRHSVISADYGSDEPVLPIVVGDTGGGRAFRSGNLQPGDTFQLSVDLATMNPEAYVVLPNGDVLIGYHCYIHGASQMQGFLVVDG